MWEDEAMMKPTAHPPISKKQVVWVDAVVVVVQRQTDTQTVIPP